MSRPCCDGDCNPCTINTKCQNDPSTMETNMTEQTDDRIYISCIGIDNQLHICLPESDVCKCGVKVRSKKVTLHDFTLYSCYECTY